MEVSLVFVFKLEFMFYKKAIKTWLAKIILVQEKDIVGPRIICRQSGSNQEDRLVKQIKNGGKAISVGVGPKLFMVEDVELDFSVQIQVSLMFEGHGPSAYAIFGLK